MSEQRLQFDQDMEEIFGMGIPQPEEVSVDEEEEAKTYALKLYERIRRIEKNVEEEVVASHSDSSISTSLTFSDDSFAGATPDMLDVKEFLKIEVNGKVTIVPSFKEVRKTKEWIKILDHHESRARDILSQLTTVDPDDKIIKKVAELKQQADSINVAHLKDKTKKNVAIRTIFVGLIEDLIVSELGSLAFHLGDVRATIDDATQGIWINNIDDGEGRRILQHLGSSRIVISKRYKFDAHQTNSLINMMFSSRMDVRAQAKLNLNAKLEPGVYHEIIANPGQVLELVCSEAVLTQMEILYLVFPQSERSSGRVCLHCSTNIMLSRAVYHTQCATIKWLTTHCRFKYDPIDQCLTPKEAIFLNAEKRRRVIEILKLHSQLTRDIVVKSAKETVIWQRRDDGRLVKIPVLSRREDEIVGSYAWRKAHGLAK